MNGLIFIEVSKFARAKLGADAWKDIARDAGVGHRIYVPVTDYPDEELIGLLNALSQRMGVPVRQLLEALGEFVVPDLIALVQTVIHPDWKTLDLIANTEHAIHEVVRRSGTNTHPPRLSCHRQGLDQVVVTYTSSRKLCTLATGIIKGVARYYGENVSLAEPTCMLRGDPLCRIVVTRV